MTRFTAMGVPEVAINTSTELLSTQMTYNIREFTIDENIAFCHAEDIEHIVK